MKTLPATLEVAGPGFINITLNREHLAELLGQPSILTPTKKKERIIIDYSSPNIAKELHVGHLRSTVMGDAIARMLRLAGHHVILQNHIGDWGTSFGKLIAHLADVDPANTQCLENIERYYVAANSRFENDDKFAQRAREAVTNLQAENPAEMVTWRRIVADTVEQMQEIYSSLGVLLQRQDIRGESAYNPELAKVIADLDHANLITESDGAKCVYVDGFYKQDGSPLPMIVQKSDGGYLYHTTDLAAVKYRVNELQADRLMYVTDSRQIHHFQHLFAVSRLVNYAPKSIALEHLVLGSILDTNGEPLKSRSGNSVLLRKLFQEGFRRALKIVRDRGGTFLRVADQEIAHIISMNSIKYADLSKNRTNDYRFDWDSMLAFEGNTAPYLLYAYVRLCSLFARGNVEVAQCLRFDIKLEETIERELALTILQFQEIFEQSMEERKPHHLCTYLYELTTRFMRFYEQCPVLQGSSPAQQESRLALCAKVSQVLRAGFDCLGIEPLPEM